MLAVVTDGNLHPDGSPECFSDINTNKDTPQHLPMQRNCDSIRRAVL